MSIYLYQFINYPNYNNGIHDILNIHLKKDKDITLCEDKTLDDCMNFIDQYKDSDNTLILYCQKAYCEIDREILKHLRKYDNESIKLKIIFFSFDWWFRGDDNWIEYCRNLFKAKNHYVFTFADNLEFLNKIHNEDYSEYEKKIIFYPFWCCYDGSYQEFNNNPKRKIGICGSINHNYPERLVIYHKILKKNQSFEHIRYLLGETSRKPRQFSNFTLRLSRYICCFASSPYHKNINLHVLVQKYYEILASGSLLLLPKSEEKYVKRIGLENKVNCIICDIKDLDKITDYILDTKNYEEINKIRKAGHEFAKTQLNSVNIYQEIKNIIINIKNKKI